MNQIKRYLPVTLAVVLIGVFWRQAVVILAAGFVVVAATGVMLGFRDWVRATLAVFAGMVLLFVGIETAIWLGNVVLGGAPPEILGYDVRGAFRPWHILAAGMALAYVASVTAGVGRGIAGAGAVAAVLVPLPALAEQSAVYAIVGGVLGIGVLFWLFMQTGPHP